MLFSHENSFFRKPANTEAIAATKNDKITEGPACSLITEPAKT